MRKKAARKTLADLSSLLQSEMQARHAREADLLVRLRGSSATAAPPASVIKLKERPRNEFARGRRNEATAVGTRAPLLCPPFDKPAQPHHHRRQYQQRKLPAGYHHDLEYTKPKPHSMCFDGVVRSRRATADHIGNPSSVGELYYFDQYSPSRRRPPVQRLRGSPCRPTILAVGRPGFP